MQGVIDDEHDGDEKAEVLQAMLKVAEDEIASKDSQIEILNQMIAANEKARAGNVARSVFAPETALSAVPNGPTPCGHVGLTGVATPFSFRPNRS